MCYREVNELVYIEMWSIIAEVLTKYIRNTEINGDDNFKVMKLILSFPFHTCLEDLAVVCIILKIFSFITIHYTHLFVVTAFFILIILQIKDQAIVWKTIYKEVELHSDLITTVKPNEILLDTASMMRNCLSTNKKCCTFIVNCLDALLSTLDYESLLGM